MSTALATETLGCRCDNCRRRLYHITKNGAVLCGDCGPIVEFGMQLWKCCGCGTLRVYGTTAAIDVTPKQLNCLQCGDVTAHAFSHRAI